MSEEQNENFSDRLIQAFAHLSEGRKEYIRERMDENGIDGGLKSGIARLAGIKTPSLLSDMLSGRAKGKRYQAELALLLAVDVGWLNGVDDAYRPDWALPSIEAYERWLMTVRSAWRSLIGGDRDGGEGSSASIGSPLIGAETKWSAVDVSDHTRRELGRRMGVAPHHDSVSQLVAGQWELLVFDHLLLLAQSFELDAPVSPEVVRAGHVQAQEATKQQDWITKRLLHRLRRFQLPAQLFKVCRLALVTQRQQRDYQGKSTEEIDDAIELLWRNQLQQQGRVGEVPEEFTEETGRTNWSKLDDLQSRYADDDNPDQRYRSHGPWSDEELKPIKPTN